MNRRALFDRLLAAEAIRLFVYDDRTGKAIKAGDTLIGNPTIGIGRELSKRGITRAEATVLCENDIDEAQRGLDAIAGWWRGLDETRQQILCEMSFNLGASGLGGFVKMLAALKAGDFNTAAIEMLDSKWKTQVGTRAFALANAMRTGRFLTTEA